MRDLHEHFYMRRIPKIINKDLTLVFEEDRGGKSMVGLYHYPSHMCMSSSSDLDTVLNTLKRLVRKYKSNDHFTEGFLEVSEYTHNLATKELYEDIRKLYSVEFEDLVDDTIAGIYKEIKEEKDRRNPFKKFLAKVKPKASAPETPKTVVKTTVALLNKPKVLLNLNRIKI